MLPLCICLLSALSVSAANASTAAEQSKLIGFLQAIWRQQQFETLLMAREEALNAPQSFHPAADVVALLRALPVAVLQMNEGGAFRLQQRVSERLLALIELQPEWWEGRSVGQSPLLARYASAVEQLRQTPVVFLLHATPEAAAELLPQLFAYCWQQKMLNAVALLPDYELSGHYYGYTPFPALQVERRALQLYGLSQPLVFAPRLRDLQGYRLSYILSGSDPRLIVYRQPSGELFVGGSAGHLVRAFALKHNCTLVQPLPMDVHGLDPSQKSKRHVRAGTVEISAGMTFPEIPFRGCSYPYEHLNLCLLVPVAADVPNYEFPLLVFSWQAFGLTMAIALAITLALNAALLLHGHRLHPLDLLLHDNCLRGLLAQSFTEIAHPPLVVRFIYLLIGVLGIVLTTSYNSCFAAYFTSAPKRPPLGSLADVRRAGMQIYAWGPELEELYARDPSLRAYASIFRPEYDYQQYLRMRDSFDGRYIYMVPTIKRTIVNEQQKGFSAPIYRAAEEVCVYRNIPFCFPLQYNSVYAAPLNGLLLDMAEFGLMDYWRQRAFRELIAAKKLSAVDVSRTKAFAAMRVDDLRYVWLGLALMLALVWLVLAVERAYYHRRRLVAVMMRRRWPPPRG